VPRYDVSKAELETLADFRYQLRRYLRFSEEVTRRKGITPLQYLLLLQLKGFPGRAWATVGELAERLQAKHHGVVALISRCEAAGLVTRSASRADGRRVEVKLTGKGDRRLEQLAGLHRAELLSVQGRFVVPDLTALRRGRLAAVHTEAVCAPCPGAHESG
jgi:DNA-binding MarR family transcriptional regulator